MRARVIIFLAALVVIAILQQQRVIGGAVPLLIAVGVYCAVLLPSIGKR